MSTLNENKKPQQQRTPLDTATLLQLSCAAAQFTQFVRTLFGGPLTNKADLNRVLLWVKRGLKIIPERRRKRTSPAVLDAVRIRLQPGNKGRGAKDKYKHLISGWDGMTRAQQNAAYDKLMANVRAFLSNVRRRAEQAGFPIAFPITFEQIELALAGLPQPRPAGKKRPGVKRKKSAQRRRIQVQQNISQLNTRK